MDAHPEVAAVTQSRYTVPDWLSPGRVMRLAEGDTRLVTLVAGVVTPLLLASPKRIFLGVIVPDTMKAGFYISPGPDPDARGITLAGSGNCFYASLSDWTSLICWQWNGYHAGGGVVRVFETYRN